MTRIWWELARRGFKRYATYRTATWAGVFTNTVFGFMIAYTLLAVYAVRTDIGGFDAQDAVTYVFVGQGLLMAMSPYSWDDVAEDVRSGNIAVHLVRPVDYQMRLLAQDMGRAAYHFVFRGIPPALFAIPFFDLRVPARWWTWPLFLLSLALGAAVSFALRFAGSCAAFWLLEIRGFARIANGTVSFLSGSVVPVALFPGALRAAAKVLPFWTYFALPLEVFLERAPWWALPYQAVWLVGALVLGRVVFARGTRKLVVQGG